MNGPSFDLEAELAQRKARLHTATPEVGEKGDQPLATRIDEGANGGQTGANVALTDGKDLAARMLAAARKMLGAKTREVPTYPVETLGPLADPALAIAEGAQLRPAMAGQSVLSVAALLAQGLHNVRSLDGIKPLSLYSLTISESGDGKSTSDRVAKKPVQERQRQDAHTYKTDVEAWAGTPKNKRGEQPQEPYRVMRDGTVEGIRRGFASGLPAQGVFSSEAADVLSGYGMRPEHRAKTAAVLNGLWDDGEVSVSRSTSGRLQLYGRRLSIHWLIQPSAAEETLADPTLTAIGFWPRFLAAWPEPAEPRLSRPWRAESDRRIAEFWRRCGEMMDKAPTDDCDGLPVLELTPEASDLLGAFFERLERHSKGKSATLGDVKPFALRATEQAARIAGVLAAFKAATQIDAQAVRNGMALAWYSLKTWHAILGDHEQAVVAEWALRLYAWLLRQPHWTASETAVLRIGPKALRSQARRDTALATLEQHGLVFRLGTTWTAEESNAE